MAGRPGSTRRLYTSKADSLYLRATLELDQFDKMSNRIRQCKLLIDRTCNDYYGSGEVVFLHLTKAKREEHYAIDKQVFLDAILEIFTINELNEFLAPHVKQYENDIANLKVKGILL